MVFAFEFETVKPWKQSTVFFLPIRIFYSATVSEHTCVLLRLTMLWHFISLPFLSNHQQTSPEEASIRLQPYPRPHEKSPVIQLPLPVTQVLLLLRPPSWTLSFDGNLGSVSRKSRRISGDVIHLLSSKRKCTKASRGTKLRSYFNFYFLYNIWKDQLYRISGSEIYEWVFRDFRETSPWLVMRYQRRPIFRSRRRQDGKTRFENVKHCHVVLIEQTKIMTKFTASPRKCINCACFLP